MPTRYWRASRVERHGRTKPEEDIEHKHHQLDHDLPSVCPRAFWREGHRLRPHHVLLVAHWEDHDRVGDACALCPLLALCAHAARHGSRENFPAVLAAERWCML